MNPVVPRIVSRPEDYQWSSFNVYFGGNTTADDEVPLSSLSVRQIRTALRTRHDLKQSGFVIDNQNNILLKSFVDYESVESIFGSKTDFFRSILITKYESEEEKYVEARLKFSDDELVAEASVAAASKFDVKQLNQLTKEQKRTIAIHLKKKTNASVNRIARILRMRPVELYFLKK